ncbi:MAG: hypothetical protein KDD64_01315 [Bdellovibrionales bacterium]|nr:hypothetical protein [Bdellovibrionales bacterium]
MVHFTLRFGFLFVFAAFSVVQSIQAQDSVRESLELSGSPVKALAASPDAVVILAASESPIGLHYTTSFGGDWKTAAGGDYSAGSVQQVALTFDAAFIIVNNQILRSDLPFDDEEWEPNWESDDNLPQQISFIQAVDSFLIYSSANSIHVYDTETNDEVDSFSAADSFQISRFGIGDSFILLGSTNGDGDYLSVAFDPGTGSLGNTSTDLSGATGIPDGLAYGSFFVNPTNGDIYQGTRDSSGENFVDLVYKSTDEGATYSATTLSTLPNAMCFTGNIVVAGARYSKDSGANFSELFRGQEQLDGGRFEDKACLIDPSNGENAYLTTNEGVDVTSNLKTNDSTPSWTPGTSGLTGTLVYTVSQSPVTEGQAVLGTSSGVAFTANFTGDEVSWVYPICPGNDCVGGANVQMDPSEAGVIYYGSGNIRKGTVSTDGDDISVTFENWASKPSDTVNYSVFGTFEALPNFLVAGYVRTEGQIDGGLYFYDKEDPENPVSSDDLDGKPIAAFLPLSSDLMFAGVGVSSEEDEELRGLYRSSDGGSTWTKETDTDLPDLLLVEAFAYDEDSDFLYFATSGEGGVPTVLRLANALNSGTDWEAPDEAIDTDESGAPSDITVDPDDGFVYVSIGNKIYRSTDNARTFELYFTGLSGEETSALESTEESDSQTQSLRARGGSRYRLVQASSAGIFALGDSVETTCSLGLNSECKGSAEKNSTCSLNVKLKNASSKVGVQGTYRLQKRKNQKKPWKNVGKERTTSSKGKGKIKVRAKKSAQYRVVFSTPGCVTTNKRLKVSK